MKLNYEEMISVANEMLQAQGNIESSFQAIKNELNNISNNWSGQASSYYVSKLKNLTNNFDNVSLELKTSINYITQTAEGYQNADYGSLAALSQLKY